MALPWCYLRFLTFWILILSLVKPWYSCSLSGLLYFFYSKFHFHEERSSIFIVLNPIFVSSFFCIVPNNIAPFPISFHPVLNYWADFYQLYKMKLFYSFGRYYSMYGNVERLACEIFRGANSVSGVDATMWQVLITPYLSFLPLFLYWTDKFHKNYLHGLTGLQCFCFTLIYSFNNVRFNFQLAWFLVYNYVYITMVPLEEGEFIAFTFPIHSCS